MRKVVKAIIFKHDRFLLQLRDYKNDIFYPNHWGFFGGEIDKFESEKDTLMREIFEELFWLPKKYKYFSNAKDIYSNCLIIYYLVYFDSDNSKLILGEGQDMQWFAVEDIDVLLTTPKNMSEFLCDENLHKEMLTL